MKPSRIRQLRDSFGSALLQDTMPFWIQHAVDRECGGFLPQLDRRGAVFCPDKPMWIEGRFTWTLSRLYNTVERRSEWLTLAAHGIEFINRHGFDKDGRVFFLVSREGKPLRKRRYLFAEVFAVLAFAEYSRAAGDPKALDTARRLMALIRDTLARPWPQPGSLEPKVNPETRSMRGHSMSMILINTLQVLREADPAGAYDPQIDAQIEEVFRYFVKPEKRALLETVGANGEYLGDLPEGRCVNPGHALETAWFLLIEARRRGDQELVKRALPIIDWSLELGWDRKHGGILYFVDVEGKPAVQYEWDMKLWWVHNEALNATLLAHVITGDRRYEEWFERILRWAHGHFPDKTCGEWFGYLHRDGSVSHDLKGNTWKGPFHLPRQQLFCHLLLKEIAG
ncbi:MAG TPA: AGE family epimerase/isomerase [Spirochaetia bacterium]|nr:AGE family epimerase/isomerase [Spirochaetia bacterium]